MIEEIKIKYDKFTTSEKKIADFILKSGDAFITMDALTIAKMSDTSSATVIRFCKKMGVSGLDQFKLLLVKDFVNDKQNEYIDPIITTKDSTNELVSKVYHNIDLSLKKTIDLLDYRKIDEITNCILDAKIVYLFGVGASSLSAYDLFHKLNRIDKKSFYTFDGNMNIEFSVHSKPDDVGIFISYGGHSVEVLTAARQMKKNGTPVISIVREGDTKLSKLSDYCLYVPQIENQVKIAALSSKFSQNLLVDILYFSIIQKNLDSTIEKIKNTAKAVHVLKEGGAHKE